LYRGGVISSEVHNVFGRKHRRSHTLPAVYAQFVTSEGNFTVRLFDTEAPRTV
jgi:hypothetical protein